MIELTLLDYLNEELEVNVYLEKPEPLESSYVLFEKTGSNKENHILSSTVAFQSYAQSLYEAVVLNTKVIKAIENIVKLDVIVSAKLNSDYNFTDTTTKQYRYQAIFDFKHY